MKLNFFKTITRKPSVKEKCEYYFKCDKGKYLIEYEIVTDKNYLMKVFESAKSHLSGFKANEKKTVFENEKELIIDSNALAKIEKALVLGLNPNKLFVEIKKDLPNFVQYNVKLTFASIKQLEDNLFFMKVKLEGLCNE